MIVLINGKRYSECKYDLKDQIEADILENSEIFFGPNTTYVDANRKSESGTFGEILPAGFLFDLSDKHNPTFYLVEVEMSSHDFYSHILPRVTKLLISLRNVEIRSKLVARFFSLADSSLDLNERFTRYRTNGPAHKIIDSIVDRGINILLIIDGEKREVSEMMEAYSDTWGNTVRVLILKKYVCGKESIHSLDPEFNDMGLVDAESVAGHQRLEGINPSKESRLAVNEKPVGEKIAIKPSTRKVSLAKIGGKGTGFDETLIGWEIAPPKEGEPYRVLFEKGRMRKTSRVKLITETKDALCIMTANSLYEIKTLGTEKNDALKEL